MATVSHLTLEELTEAQIRTACAAAGCQGAWSVGYYLYDLTWVIWHGTDRLLLEKMRPDVLAAWLRDLHRPLVEQRLLCDSWPLRAVDPLLGG